MFNRREFLSSSAATAITSYFSSPGKATVAFPTRYNVKTSFGQDMLKIYADAVKEMKARADMDPEILDLPMVHPCDTRPGAERDCSGVRQFHGA